MNLSKIKLSAAIALASVGGCAVAAEQTVDVDVKVEGTEGKVMIIKDVNGEVSKITETIDLSDGADMQEKLDALMEAHGIDVNVEGADIHKEVIVLKDGELPHGDHKMMFIQKSNDVNVDLENGVAKVIIKKDNNGEVEVIEESMEVGDDVNLDEFIDEIMAKHNIDAADGEVHKKIIKLDKRVIDLDHSKPRLGFMAAVSDQGWDVISVVPDSGAEVAGILAGDVIVSIDGNVTGKNNMGLDDFAKSEYESGDLVDVVVLRDGAEMVFDVEAKVVNSPDVLMKNIHRWIDKDGNVEIENVYGPKTFEFKLDGNSDFKFGENEVHVMTTGDADAYFFSSGKMNQWLGKTHHFSTITKDLGQYFGVDQGVLVLEVDANNKLGLKDGDVIQSINGEVVSSPKDVVKKMSALKNDDQVEIEIYRNKEKLYLES